MHSIQKRILELAKKQDISQLGYRKLGDKVKVSHPQQVKYHLQKLIDSGRLIRTPFGVLRVSAPSKQISNVFNIPILGQANCGEPLSSADESDWGALTITPSLVKSADTSLMFAVKAVGDSMNKCSVDGVSINDGDYVIIDGTIRSPESGKYIVSSVGGLANIKKFVKDEVNKLIRLESESTKDYPPILIDPKDVDSYFVHGQVVRVLPG